MITKEITNKKSCLIQTWTGIKKYSINNKQIAKKKNSKWGISKRGIAIEEKQRIYHHEIQNLFLFKTNNTKTNKKKIINDKLNNLPFPSVKSKSPNKHKSKNCKKLPLQQR